MAAFYPTHVNGVRYDGERGGYRGGLEMGVHTNGLLTLAKIHGQTDGRPPDTPSAPLPGAQPSGKCGRKSGLPEVGGGLS